MKTIVQRLALVEAQLKSTEDRRARAAIRSIKLREHSDNQAHQLAAVRGWMAQHCREPYMEAYIRALSTAMTEAGAEPEQSRRYEFADSTTWIEKVERRLHEQEDWQRKFEQRLEQIEVVTTRPQDVP